MKTHVCRNELRAIYRTWQIWLMLATQDIKIRYQRSAIGPLWVTIRIAVTIYSTGYVYSHLFKTNTMDYFPFIASGLIGWGFLSSLLTESAHIFLESAGYIRNQESFLSMFILRMIMRNMIVLAHNLLAFIPLYAISSVTFGYHTLQLIPHLILLACNAYVWGTYFAILGVRYRDFPQVIQSVLQILFLLTPIMWMPQLLPPSLQSYLDYHVLYHALNCIRYPLLNQAVPLLSELILCGCLGLGSLCCFVSLRKYKTQLVFWL